MISNLSFIQSSYFYGGTITWRPMNTTDTNSKISILFTQSYQWQRGRAYCNQSYILNKIPLIPGENGTLKCVTTPSTACGDYQSISINEYCTDFSVLNDLSSGQISTIENITIGSEFCIAYTDSSWIDVQTINCFGESFMKRSITGDNQVIPLFNDRGEEESSTTTCTLQNPTYSIGCCVNLTRRSDGFINSPPIATVISPIKVPIDVLTKITIPVIDANNDIIRCRWAEQTEILNECGDVCEIPPSTTLDTNNCSLAFDSTGKKAGDFFAITLMVEDFSNQSTYTPYSSVPIQFLIEIIDTPSCLLKPTISSNLSKCTPIQVGIKFNFTITIEQGCSNTTIEDFFRVSPLNMYKSSITKVSATNTWIVTETWIPNIEQVGSQIYCAIATDSINIQSNSYCLTFTVALNEENLYCPGDSAPITSTSSISTISSTNARETVTVTVLVPVSTEDNTKILALSLGLGIPLALLISGLALYHCCKQSKCFREKFNRQNDERTEPIDDKNQNNKHLENQLPDYREQYINNDQKFKENNQTISYDDEHLLTSENSFASMSISDFNMNNTNVTTTSLFSPSISSFPNDIVQETKYYSTPATNSMNHGSILMQAYSVQQNQRSTYSS